MPEEPEMTTEEWVIAQHGKEFWEQHKMELTNPDIEFAIILERILQAQNSGEKIDVGNLRFYTKEHVRSPYVSNTKGVIAHFGALAIIGCLLLIITFSWEFVFTQIGKLFGINMLQHERVMFIVGLVISMPTILFSLELAALIIWSVSNIPKRFQTISMLLSRSILIIAAFVCSIGTGYLVKTMVPTVGLYSLQILGILYAIGCIYLIFVIATETTSKENEK